MSKSMLFLYAETPLHAGSGRALGTVDLPIQRERTTGYPMIQSGGIKGRLRAEIKTQKKLSEQELYALFGPETDNASEHAGALSFGDARLLLFPVRSLAGVFAWVASVDALARFVREIALTGMKLQIALPKDNNGNLLHPKDDKVWVSGKRNIVEVTEKGQKKNTVVLEEFCFTAEDVNLAQIAAELVKTLPDTPEYAYWKQALMDGLCILPEDAFRDFVLYATEVQTHIKLDPDKKTVETGALWTAESLPVDSLLYVPVLAVGSRNEKVKLDAAAVMKKLTDNLPARINFGGDETTGQGFVALKVLGGA